MPVILTNKKVQLRRPEAQKSPLENNWTALRAARLNLFGKSESFLMVELYNEARTHFLTKS
jgi:hypothetical protein